MILTTFAPEHQLGRELFWEEWRRESRVNTLLSFPFANGETALARA